MTAVATILIIRTQLWLTNYPQLGGDDLHISHMLWGGLMMLIVIIAMMAFINRWTRHFGAFLGGIGFGFFIDELGKFITQDNNYFFKPTAALIYVIFVVLYLSTRQFLKQRSFTPDEYLMNAIELTKEAATRELDVKEKRLALFFLSRADQKDPLVKPLRALLKQIDAIPAPKPSRLTVWGGRLRDGYYALIKKPWFTKALTWFFVITAVGSFIQIIDLIFSISESAINFNPTAIFDRVSDESGNLSWTSWASLISSVVSGVLIIVGAWKLRRSRLDGYRMFEWALLVSIFITQVFAFVQSQFIASIGLGIDILILIALRFMIKQEQQAKITPGRTRA